MPAKLSIRTKSKEWEFTIPDGESIVLGRSSRTDVQILDKAASGLHFEIRSTDDKWRIKDLQSTNGTFLNDTKIDTAKLSDGDVIRLGAVEIVFTIEVHLSTELEEALAGTPGLPEVADETTGSTGNDDTELAQAVKLPQDKGTAKAAPAAEGAPDELQELDEINELEDFEEDLAGKETKQKTPPTKPQPTVRKQVDEDHVETEEDIVDLDAADIEDPEETDSADELFEVDDDDVELLEIE